MSVIKRLTSGKAIGTSLMASFSERLDTNCGEIPRIDEARPALARGNGQNILVPYFLKMRGTEILHIETRPEERVVDSRPFQMPFDLPVRHDRYLFGTQKGKQDEILHACLLGHIDEWIDVRFDIRDGGRTHQEDLAHPVEGVSPRIALGEVKRYGDKIIIDASSSPSS